jgi:uncharacterized protein
LIILNYHNIKLKKLINRILFIPLLKGEHLILKEYKQNKYKQYHSSHILEELNCPSYVIEHSKAVVLKANTLALNFEGKVDLDLVKAGAMLHDIGRSETNGIKHAIIGAEILQSKGFPIELVNIVERHIGAGISREEAEIIGLPPKDYVPVTLEEKLVAHADNLIHGTREVDLDFVIRKWQNKMGRGHSSISRLLKLDAELNGEAHDKSINKLFYYQ